MSRVQTLELSLVILKVPLYLQGKKGGGDVENQSRGCL